MVVSNYSHTMQQAMFVMFFFLILMMLTSGLFTPVESMPAWMQHLTIINPIRHFAQVMRLIYLKSSGLLEMLPPISLVVRHGCGAQCMGGVELSEERVKR